jgi:macrodomain Ter protein organizer (MatP/YcbG family)
MRKSIFGKNTKNMVITVDFSDWKKIENAAIKQKLTISGYVRKALKDQMKGTENHEC